MIFVENEDIADESTALIHEVLQMIIKLDMPTLYELHENLEKVTTPLQVKESVNELV